MWTLTFACQKKREIFDKDFCVWRFLEHISRKNFLEFKIGELLAAPKKKKHQILLLVKTIKVAKNQNFPDFLKFPKEETFAKMTEKREKRESYCP